MPFLFRFGCGESGFLILKVSSLESKIQQEHDARTNTENRIAIVEGGLEAAKSDEQAVHSQLDAQAAAYRAGMASNPRKFDSAGQRDLSMASVSAAQKIAVALGPRGRD